MKTKIQYLQITKGAPEKFQRAFIGLYQEVFADAPYFEEYSYRQVKEDIWENHLEKGCIIVALNGAQLIGFGCCLPIINLDTRGPDGAVKEFLQSVHLPFALEDGCYMSEIAVKKECRRQGIGSELVIRRLHWAQEQGLTYYIMRTASVGSNSLNLYLRIGAKQTSFMQNISDKEVVFASRQRIFLYGKVN